jgi:Cu/Ag efflux pump CusA
VVILGGLVTSTLLNLFIIPVLYLWLGRRRHHEQ